MSAQLPVTDRTRAMPAPGFGYGGDVVDVPPALARRISRTIGVGVFVAVVFVVGLGAWAMVSPVAGAVPAQGVVHVENNRKTVKHLEAGILRRILVREGDRVRAGQLLFVFDDSQAKAQLAVLQSSADSLAAERARYEAEVRDASSVTFPPELLARRGDPAVAAVIASQQALFTARRDTLRSQVDVGRQRTAELGTQIDGLKAQVASIDAQLGYNTDEMHGVQQLYAGGYAPRTRLLALQRSEASLGGNRGEEVASIARARQTIGETRVSVIATRQARIAEAAAGLEQAQDKLADVGPRLAAAKDVLEHTQVRSPADGYVLNLTQFTEGGVVGSGESMLDVVPVDSPLIIVAQVRPQDVHAIHRGMKALVTLTAYNTRTTPRVNADVIGVSADATVDQHTGKSYFNAELRLPPVELKRLPADVKLYPGMPAQVAVITGSRTIMDYLVQPLRDSLSGSLHEQ